MSEPVILEPIAGVLTYIIVAMLYAFPWAATYISSGIKESQRRGICIWIGAVPSILIAAAIWITTLSRESVPLGWQTLLVIVPYIGMLCLAIAVSSGMMGSTVARRLLLMLAGIVLLIAVFILPHMDH